MWDMRMMKFHVKVHVKQQKLVICKEKLILTSAFGLIESGIRFCIQVVKRYAIHRREADADADRKTIRLVGITDHFTDAHNSLCFFCYSKSVWDIFHQDEKFIAADSANDITLAETVFQSIGQRNQEIVAGLVSICIVECFEMIDIQNEQCMKGRRIFFKSLLNVLPGKSAVQQASHFIALRSTLQISGSLLDAVDIPKRPDGTQMATFWIDQKVDISTDPHCFAVWHSAKVFQCMVAVAVTAELQHRFFGKISVKSKGFCVVGISKAVCGVFGKFLHCFLQREDMRPCGMATVTNDAPGIDIHKQSSIGVIGKLKQVFQLLQVPLLCKLLLCNIPGDTQHADNLMVVICKNVFGSRTVPGMALFICQRLDIADQVFSARKQPVIISGIAFGKFLIFKNFKICSSDNLIWRGFSSHTNKWHGNRCIYKIMVFYEQDIRCVS